MYFFFSFHEIGLYDHPAVVKLIKDKTKVSQIIFIAHSMSATTGLIYASLKPQEAARDVKVFVGLAPPAFFRYLLPFRRGVDYIKYIIVIVCIVN